MLARRPVTTLAAAVGLSLTLPAGCGGSNLTGGTPGPTGQRWGDPVELASELAAPTSPRIAIDATTGDAFAVWQRLGGVWASTRQ